MEGKKFNLINKKNGENDKLVIVFFLTLSHPFTPKFGV